MAGGIDSRHHHDNNSAQTEAFFDCCNNYVNNFWHAGDLNIHGIKMSKSV